MEDENTKEENQPSTSKKESQRTNSGNDLYDDRGHDDRASNSETSVSATYSVRSRIDMTDARPEVPKPALKTKAPERKKRGRRAGGRVEKRRRSYTRRQVRRAPLRRKPRPTKDKDRELSVSTIFTRLSSRSGSRTPGCVHCGHRCCRRRAQRFVVRYENRMRRYKERRQRHIKRNKTPKKKIEKAKPLKKKPGIKPFGRQAAISKGSKQIQIGSRSQMLSPLFVNTNATPQAEHKIIAPRAYCDVSPEMIFEALRNLTLWKQDVPTVLLLEYIRRHYPVNKVENELFVEIKEKLRIASIVGMVIQTSEDYWCLSCELQQRRLTATHVTLFWQAYADTLNPLAKKEIVLQKERSEQQTNTRCRGNDGNDLI